MKATRCVKITVEKHEIRFVHFGQNASLYCQNCEMQRQHLTVAQMAIVLSISETDVFRLCENKQIHSVETVEGQILICADSILTFEKDK